MHKLKNMFSFKPLTLNIMNQFENDLKSILESYSPEYNPSAWARIKNQFRKYQIIKVGVIASVAVLISTATLLFWSTAEKTNSNDSKVQLSDISTKTISTPINNYNKQKVKESSPIVNSNIQTPSNEALEVLEKSYEQTSSSIDKSIEKSELNTHNDNQAILANNDSRNIPTIKIEKTRACAPFDLNASCINMPANANVKWYLDGSLISNSDKCATELNQKGMFLLKATIKTSDGHEFNVSENVEVLESPIAQFSYSIANQKLILTNQSKNATSQIWNFVGIETNEDDPQFEVMYSGEYPISLQVTHSNGCQNTMNQIITYKVSHDIFAPTAFSPDGDGVNDVFLLKYEVKLGFVYTLQVYNSQGHMVYQGTQPNEGWDGRGYSMANANERFVWKLSITDPRGQSEHKEGYFVIK